MANRFGLQRQPDAATRRKVRQNSKFSCVICRAPFCTYEHFDPPYKDAEKHDPEGMCLLCGICQLNTTAGRLSKEVIRERYAARRAEQGVKSARDNFMFFSRMPTVKIGRSTIRQVDTVVCTDKFDCLSFQHDPDSGLFLMNMRIYDPASKQVCQIVENTWSSQYQPWDFEFSGKEITFRSSPRTVIFSARLDSENCLIEITHLNMTVEHSRIMIENGDILLTRLSRDGTRAVQVGTRINVMGGHAAFFLDNRDDVPVSASQIPIVHGSFGGITIGRGASCAIAKWTLGVRGVRRDIAPSANETDQGPRAAYVKGKLVVKTVHFPFWEEEEYYLNGIKLSQKPFSVDDAGECEKGYAIEIFHVGAPDARLFDESTGLVGLTETDLEHPPARPHSFL